MATKTVHGFYRFTDIFFEWSHVLPCIEDIRQFKAFIAYDCLVNPTHPLSNGKDGIELWLGTLPSGETRLMFTSAQIEYIRYWLDAMKLTTQPLPLPSSECLVVASDLVASSPVLYQDGPTLKKAIKTIDKNNKKLRGASSLLNSRRLNFEKTRVFWGARRGAWCAVDFEAWDRDHTIIQEFGYSVVQWGEHDQQLEEQGHLTVKEARQYYNTYVPNHRDNYNFGRSEDVDRATFKRKIHDLIVRLSTDQPLFLIFHDYKQDLKYLTSKSIEAPLANITPMLPETTPESGIYIVDTSDMFGALEGEGKNARRSLDRVCRLLGITTSYLHNAGNDAHYTLLAAIEMASGDPVDMQRDKRWPGRTDNAGPDGQGVRVQFDEQQDESDYSDTEAVMGGGYDPKTGRLRQPVSRPADEDKMEL